jgi:DNA-binding MarR family transcriptional regulator
VIDSDDKHQEVLGFVQEYIDTVPELEALLLLWQHRPNSWKAEELAQRLYIPLEETTAVLLDLKRKQLISVSPNEADSFRYNLDSPERNDLIRRTEELYRRQVVRISTMIHSKPSSAVRDFARAFRFTKER